MTPIFCCGFECGVAGTVGQHWTLSGTASISTSTKRTGQRSLRCNPSSANGVATSGFSLGSTNNRVFRAAVYFASLPSNDNLIATMSNLRAGAVFNASDGKIYAGWYNGSAVVFGATGVSVSTGQWYVIDVSINSSANPWLINVKVNGASCGQYSAATAALNDSQLALGFGVTTTTADVYFDDVLVSSTLADYPLGYGYVNHFVPTSDGTHNVAGAADFRRGDTTTDILNATTTAYQLVDDVPLDDVTPDTDDHIRIVAPANVTDYVELVFGPAPGISTPTKAPRAVEVICEVFAAGTLASDEIIKLNDNGTVDNVYDGTAVAGVTTGTYKRKHYALSPTGGAWTVAAGAGNFNNIRLRYGFATDANPDKSLMCAMIEAEFSQPPVAGQAVISKQARNRAATI